MADAAYIMFWDTSNVGDLGVTADLVDFPGSENVVLMLDRELVLPERIYFEADAETLAEVDYPDNSAGWPIMSERMRAILLPTAPRHRVIPVIMLDDTIPDDERFDGTTPRPGVTIEGFAAVQLLERTDAMDMERSEFTRHPSLAGRARDIKKLVLKDIELPPLFRLTSYPSALFVSSAARRELENAGIRGVDYLPLDRIL